MTRSDEATRARAGGLAGERAGGSAASPGAGGAAGRRVPDFFIVGHHKCGTTALYEMLRRHPQIYMPELKEPKFFASDLPARLSPSDSGRLPRTLEEYLSLFQAARPEQRVGEASPSYLSSRAAAAEIARVRPDARIVAILREPASFLRSYHLQLVQSRAESERDLRKAIAAGATDRRDGDRPPGSKGRLSYFEHVRYVEQLRRYRAVFGPEQMLVLIYDDFRADNEATVRRVLRFLGVDDTVPVAASEANPTVRVRSPRLDDAARALYAGEGRLAGAVKASARALLPDELRRRLFGRLRRRLVYAQPRPPDAQLIGEMRRRFKGEVAALSEYLGRDLVSLWGYDEVG